jgi:AcrR family transcriptional regulator
MTTDADRQKTLILEQGIETITRIGVRAFTVESLASQLGMSKKTIYKFFPSKEVLLESAVDHLTGVIAEKFRSIMAAEPNPIFQFYKIMEFISDWISRFQIDKIAEIKIRYPELWEKIESFRLERREDFYRILMAAQHQGYVRSDVDIRIVATLYMNIINSTFQPEFFIKNNLTPVETLNTFLLMVTQGLFTPEGRAVARRYSG